MFDTKVITILIIAASLMFLGSEMIRRYLKVEKREIFSYNHVNEKHKKIDWTVRIIFLTSMIVIFYLVLAADNNNVNSDNGIFSSYLLPILLIVNVIISELIRAFMEWKYAENRKAYIFTLSQLIFLLIVAGLTISLLFFIS